MGTCGESCQADDGCPNGWKCRPFLETKDEVLVPAGTRGVTGARRLVCAPPAKAN